MLIWGLRGLFVVLVAAVVFSAVNATTDPAAVQFQQRYAVLIMLTAIFFSMVVIGIDIILPRKSLAALSGAFIGLLVGMVAAYGISLVFDMLIGASSWSLGNSVFVVGIKLLIGIICCYLSISFIVQTKDDIRFVIPYVEFQKQTRGSHPLVLDTSVIIDGRVADICETRIIDSPLIIPRFVLQELQTIADSSDKLKRVRGRRGLDMLNKLQSNEKIEIKISDMRLPTVEESESVDQKLVSLAKKIDGRVVTNDYNLNKIAQLRGVAVININDLANALKPVVLPGETIAVKMIKAGEEHGQGVGYLEDGTMVVGENCRERLNEDVVLTVTSVLQTSAGRMIFGRPEGAPAAQRRGPTFRPPLRGNDPRVNT